MSAGDRAFLGWSDGRVLMGVGPFQAAASPPDDGVAFYHNDFSLSRPEPWQVPASHEWLDADEAAGHFRANEPPAVSWRPLDASVFAGVFQEISDAIRRGQFEKTVPATVECGAITAGDRGVWAARAMGCPEPLVPYGFVSEHEGFVGQSPEYLLRLRGRRLRTMALAGTARSEECDVLAVDEKEIREHEFVVQALVSKLGDLGELSRGGREIMALGPIVHFHTPIEVALERDERVSDLIRRLHPTPALGPLPRTPETLASLVRWRDRLGVPAEFGAPFGASVDGEFQGIVAIRGLWWRGDEIRLPAGCGVIEASRLVNEWRELRLKRAAVKERFGL